MCVSRLSPLERDRGRRGRGQGVTKCRDVSNLVRYCRKDRDNAQTTEKEKESRETETKRRDRAKTTETETETKRRRRARMAAP